MLKRKTRAFTVALAAAATFAAGAAPAENLTGETRKLLEAANLDASILRGLDEELAVPASLVEAAKREGKVRVQLQMSARQFANVSKVFRARYPGIELEFTRGIGPQTQKVLVAYRTGNVIVDVIAAYDSRVDEFRKAGLAVVSDLPAYRGLRDMMKTPGGTDAADKMNYWCTMYSAKRVKKEDLPKTWDDVLTMPRWRNGRVAVASNSGQTFLPTLGMRLGDDWADGFLTRLFRDVRPQLRKETLAAIGKLITVGEYDMSFAVQAYISARDAKRGMPVAAHCPEPIVVTWGKLGILGKSPHPNAARLYVNWHISKEGQIANYHYAFQVPVHSELTGRRFLSYPDTILGKKLLYRTDDVIRGQRKYVRMWMEQWAKAGGPDLSRGRSRSRGGGGPAR